LSPKLLVMNLRDQVFEEGPRLLEDPSVEAMPLVPDVVDDEVLWSCTTCGACMQECPVDIEHVDTIVDLRRNLVMAESRFPAEAGTMLRGVEGPNENPWSQPASARTDWIGDIPVRVLGPGDPAPEYLFWVGCAGAFDDRAKKTTQSVARLLNAAGGGWATSTSSRCSPSRTSPRSPMRGSRRSWRPVPTASTRSPTNTPTTAPHWRSCITPSCCRTSLPSNAC